MILSKKQTEILKIFHINLVSEFSISDILKKLGLSSRAWVYRYLEEFCKQGILISKKVGNTKTYSLNLNINTINHLSYLDTDKYSSSNINKQIIEPLLTNKCNYCLIVFGSYAKNKSANSSDIDLCFLIDSKKSEKDIKSLVESIKLKSIKEIDDHYITTEELVKMLLWDKENLGKQIFKDNIIVFNHIIYYNAIKNAIKNGFKG
jgi:predicted nucleotidyltransferase